MPSSASVTYLNVEKSLIPGFVTTRCVWGDKERFFEIISGWSVLQYSGSRHASKCLGVKT